MRSALVVLQRMTLMLSYTLRPQTLLNPSPRPIRGLPYRIRVQALSVGSSFVSKKGLRAADRVGYLPAWVGRFGTSEDSEVVSQHLGIMLDEFAASPGFRRTYVMHRFAQLDACEPWHVQLNYSASSHLL